MRALATHVTSKVALPQSYLRIPDVKLSAQLKLRFFHKPTEPRFVCLEAPPDPIPKLLVDFELISRDISFYPPSNLHGIFWKGRVVILPDYITEVPIIPLKIDLLSTQLNL